MHRRSYFRGRWLVGHVLILALVVLMGRLAIWQFDRHDQRLAQNARTAESLRLDASSPTAGREWARVTASGRWDAAKTYLVRYVTWRGQPGYYVVSPLRTSDGVTFMVNRGWINAEAGEKLSANDPALSGDISLVGYTRNAASVIPDAELRDVATNAGDPSMRTTKSIASMWVQIATPTNKIINDASVLPGSALTNLAPLDGPDLSEGPHLGYAFQWMGFCVVAIVGWTTLCVRVGRDPSSAGELQK